MGVDFYLQRELERDGWKRVDPFVTQNARLPFVGRRHDSRAPVVVMSFAKAGWNRLLHTAWFASNAEGPPHFAHGGAIAAALDDAMAAALWSRCGPVLLTKLTVEYLRMVPLRTTLRIETSVTRGKKQSTASAQLYLDHEILAAKATASFAIPSLKAKQRLGWMPDPAPRKNRGH